VVYFSPDHRSGLRLVLEPQNRQRLLEVAVGRVVDATRVPRSSAPAADSEESGRPQAEYVTTPNEDR
jgi:hypothetical protein